MYIIELVQQICRDMWKRKLRSLLALFGIVWGAVTVVLLLALGNGFSVASRNNMHGYVDGTLIFNPGTTSQPWQGTPIGTDIKLTAAAAEKLKTVFSKKIIALSPVFYKSTKISYKEHFVDSNVQGVDASYLSINHKSVAPGGRFIDNFDIKAHRAVVFIGPELKQNLFPQQNPIGKKIFINNVPFIIIGMLPHLLNTGEWYNNLVMIPYTTYTVLWGNETVTQVVLLPRDIATSNQLQTEITSYLSGVFHFDPTDTSAFYIFNMNQVYEFFKWFFGGIELFLGFCGAITLGVGGIGVANVMFLIVTERTQEIGLRRAIGATDKHIMQQIMLEALIIVIIGALIGFIISGLTILLLQYINLPQWLGKPTLSILVFLTTIVVLTITALLAGYFPAKRASKMEPVTALSF